MAFSTSITKIVYFSLLMILGIAICLEAGSLKLKKTELAFYMHDWEGATKESPYVTNIPVAGNQKIKYSILTFGTINVYDDALTVGIERNSTEIGRAHGTFVNSALDASDLYLVMSVVFTDKKYNGSTIQLQGSDRFFLKYRDVSVVGGTGFFKMATGLATIETVFLDLVALNAILRLNLTVYHY